MKFKSIFWVLHLIITLVLIVIFIYLSPYIQFHDNEYLTSALSKFIVSAILISIWAICHLRIKKATNDNPPIEPSDDQKPTKINSVIPLKLWKKESIDGKDIPIVIVTGPENAGKTALLSLLEKPVAKVDYDGSQWYLFNDFIAIEIPLSSNLEQWANLLSKIKPWKKRATAIIYCFSMHNSKKEFESNFKYAAQQLIEFERYLKRSIQVYFVLNQIDRLVGFQNFSQHLDEEHRKQLFSFSSDKEESNEWLNDVCSQIKLQINNFRDQRLSQLELHTSSDERYKLYEFAEKFNSAAHHLKQGLQSLLSNWSGCITVKGIFFSSLKSTESSDHFFMHSFWPYVIKQPNEISALSTEYLKQYSFKIKVFFTCVIIATFIFFVIYWSRSFFLARATLDDMTYQISTKSAISLNQLQYWQRELKFQAELAPVLRIGEGLQIELNKLYIRKLTTQVNGTLGEWFHQGLAGTPGIELYKNLRAYLMLGNLAHRNTNILHHWLNNNPTAVSSNLFNTYIDNKLTLALDANLIRHARENLMSLSRNEISYLLFLDHSNATQSNILLFSMDELKGISNFFNLRQSSFNFPEIYTKYWLLNKYDLIYDQTYHEFSQINWVMNSELYTHNETLSEQHDFILNFYLQQYLDEWKSQFLNLQMVRFNSLQDISQALNALSQPNSAFDTLLYKLSYNTSFEIDKKNPIKKFQAIKNERNITLIQTYFKSDFGDIDQFIQANPQSSALNYENIKVILQSLSQELTKLNSLADRNQVLQAFIRMNQLGAPQDAFQTLEQAIPNVPQPLQGWLQQLCDQTWRLLLKQALDQLTFIWNQSVMGFYSSALEGKYPIDINAKENVSLSDFNNFYAPKIGVLAQFYQNYLGSLITSLSPDGLLENATNQNTGLNPVMLSILKQASSIQKSFFNDAKSGNVGIDFYLEPYDLSPNVAKVTLMIGGQALSYGHGPREYKHFVWPGDDQSTKFTWVDLNGREYQDISQEPWGFFKLLQQATIKMTDNGMLVTFHRGNFSATFTLKTTSAFNPFAVFKDIPA